MLLGIYHFYNWCQFPQTSYGVSTSPSLVIRIFKGAEFSYNITLKTSQLFHRVLEAQWPVLRLVSQSEDHQQQIYPSPKQLMSFIFLGQSCPNFQSLLTPLSCLFYPSYLNDSHILLTLQSLSLSLFLLFRATPTAYRSSQARGRIRATAAGLPNSHSNARSEPSLRPNHSSWPHQILDPLSKSRDWTCILIDLSPGR